MYLPRATRKVDVELLDKGNSNFHGARLVHFIITMIQTSRLSTKKIFLSVCWLELLGID